MAERKYYVVWKGRKTGIFTSWGECSAQVNGFQGAQYKSFTDLKSAEGAFAAGYVAGLAMSPDWRRLPPERRPLLPALATDAACSGNPGLLEYRGVDVESGKQLFHQGPFTEGTNNIGEFLALVHALAMLESRSPQMPIYTDSENALAWVKSRRCATRLAKNENNRDIFELIQRAEAWLREHDTSNPLIKWETSLWGEVPADFGRK